MFYLPGRTLSTAGGALMSECRRYLGEAAGLLSALDVSGLEAAATACIECIGRNGTIFFCGNGGSAADSQHFAAELVGRFRIERKPLRALALTENCAAITAIANDYSYDEVFSRQLAALGRPGDVLVAISTSGSSPSILKALEVARTMRMGIVAFTGLRGARFAELADSAVIAPAEESGHVQEALLAAGHALCSAIEAACGVRD
jgi:D-sedoheptulose 7-phosphate isomerase